MFLKSDLPRMIEDVKERLALAELGLEMCDMPRMYVAREHYVERIAALKRDLADYERELAL